MNNAAYKVREQDQQQKKQKTVRQVVRKTKRKITVGEKIVYSGFVALMLFGSVQIISNQSSLYSISEEVQSLDGKIDKQEAKNNELKLQVTELSAYDRIWTKAKELGLKLNENNVKVVND